MSFVYQDEKGGAAGSRPESAGPGWLRFIKAVIRLWALIGGIMLALLMLVVVVSTASLLALNRPLPGDYEMVKHFVAIAIFCFLPYCQLTGANVTVDIFTEGMSARAKSAMLVFSSLFAIVFAAVLLRQMSLGFADYLRFPETTATLHIPLWTAFPPALVSLGLLIVAALITLGEGVIGVRAPASAPAAAKG